MVNTFDLFDYRPAEPTPERTPIVVGIDPGAHGAVVGIRADDGHLAFLNDMPGLEVETGRRTRGGNKAKSIHPDFHAAARLLETANKMWRVEAVALENLVVVNRSRGRAQGGADGERGATSALTASRAGVWWGMWAALCAALGLRRLEVAAASWKKSFALTGKDKKASLLVARSLWPEAGQSLALVKHDGRAEALLIAAHARRNLRSEP